MEQYEWLRGCLMAGESVLWRGKPGQGHVFTAYDLYLVPFSLMWGGFALYWELAVIAADGPFFMKLWGIPFVLVGLYMIAGRFFVQQYMRKRTYYAITNYRVMQFRGNKLTSLNRNTIPEIHMTMHRDGSGTIVFDRYRRGRSRYIWGGGAFADASGHAGQTDPMLENIPDVNAVYRILSGQSTGLHMSGSTWNENGYGGDGEQ